MNSQKRIDSNVNIQLYLHVMNNSNGIHKQQINKNNDSWLQIFFNVKSNQELKKKEEEETDKKEEGDRRSSKKRRMWQRKRGNVEEKYKNITRKI